MLADDSGLELAPLNGAPGVRSARYAADDCPAFKNAYTPLSPDEANNQRLLRELAGVPPEKRAGRFVCALAAAQNGNVLQIFEGEVHGTILSAPRGRHGFGYDPLFNLPQLGKTTAELTPQEKAEVVSAHIDRRHGRQHTHRSRTVPGSEGLFRHARVR